MISDYKKMFLLFSFTVFLLLFVGYLGGFNLDSVQEDYKNHYFNSLGQAKNMVGYPPAIKILSIPFSFNLQAFLLFTGILTGLIIPFLLYLNDKKFSIVWLYFSAINFFWAITGLGLLAQSLTVVLILVYLLQKNWLIKLFIVLLSVFVQSYAIFLFLMLFIIDLFLEKDLFKNFFGFAGCFAIVPKEMQETMKQNFLFGGLTVKDATSFLITGFPFPFLFWSILSLWQKNNKILFYGLACLFVAVFFTGEGMRILLISEIFFLFGLSSFYESQKNSGKIVIICFSFIIFCYNIFSWFSGFLKSSGLC